MALSKFECEVPAVDDNGFDGIQLKVVMKLVSDVPLALLGLEFGGGREGGPFPNASVTCNPFHCFASRDSFLLPQTASAGGWKE